MTTAESAFRANWRCWTASRSKCLAPQRAERSRRTGPVPSEKDRAPGPGPAAKRPHRWLDRIIGILGLVARDGWSPSSSSRAARGPSTRRAFGIDSGRRARGCRWKPARASGSGDRGAPPSSGPVRLDFKQGRTARFVSARPADRDRIPGYGVSRTVGPGAPWWRSRRRSAASTRSSSPPPHRRRALPWHAPDRRRLEFAAMNTRRRPGSTPRSAALIALAALAVHQLRYLLAFGSDAHKLRQGHAYLFQSLPVLIGFGLSAIAASLVRQCCEPGGHDDRLASPTRAALRDLDSGGVRVQETAEGLLFAGHASGVAAVFGAGGWLPCRWRCCSGRCVRRSMEACQARVAGRPRRVMPAAAAPPRRHRRPARELRSRSHRFRSPSVSPAARRRSRPEPAPRCFAAVTRVRG